MGGGWNRERERDRPTERETESAYFDSYMYSVRCLTSRQEKELVSWCFELSQPLGVTFKRKKSAGDKFSANQVLSWREGHYHGPWCGCHGVYDQTSVVVGLFGWLQGHTLTG